MRVIECESIESRSDKVYTQTSEARILYKSREYNKLSFEEGRLGMQQKKFKGFVCHVQRAIDNRVVAQPHVLQAL